MGRKALLAVLWLCTWTVTCSRARDNVGVASAPRLYREAPQGVYASAYAGAAPFGAFSFQVPTAVPTAKPTSNPVKRESIVTQNSNGFLKDSYGNMIAAPQAFETFPQQFLPFQQQPAYVAQPLTAAPTFNSLQKLTPQWPWGVSSPLTHHGAFARPFTFPGSVKNLPADWDAQFQLGTSTNAQQSKNKLFYSAQGFNWLQNEPKYQWLDDDLYHSENYEAPRKKTQSLKTKVQTPIQHTVRTNQNGQDVVVQIETKPPLPLVDLRLLEPLKYFNSIE